MLQRYADGIELFVDESNPTIQTCSEMKLFLQALYKEDFEKNKGKGFSVVADTPEMQRLKKTQDQISNVGPVPLQNLPFYFEAHFLKQI